MPWLSAEDDKRAEAINNAGARARAKTRAGAQTKASGAMVESNEGQVAEAPKYDSAEVRDETLAKTNNVEAAQATEDVGTKTEQGARTESKEDGVNIYDFQKLGTEQLASNTTAASSFLDTVQAIVAEASDYSRRSLENSSSFLAKLLDAKSFDIQIHSEYAKRSYESFVVQAKKMGKLYSDLAKEFFKPIQTFNANDARKSGL
jgi:hypothetical protein